jgi:hypothetical protein
MEMTEPKPLGIALFALFSLVVFPLVQALPDQGEVESAALLHVVATDNYVGNGGYGERVLNVSLGEEISLVVVSYQTRSVGMLQVIGSFTSYIKVDSSSLEVLGSETSATYQVEQGGQGSSGSSSGSGTVGPDPGETPVGTNTTDPYEPLRERAIYTINRTLGLIWTTSVDANFTEALDLVDWAWETMEAGDYDTALDIASKAYGLVVTLIYGDTTPLPDDPYIYPAPELWGFIIIFDHEPTPEDWTRLEEEFGARYGGDAQGYLGEKNAYFVQTNTTTPEELRQVEGIEDAQEVLFFKTQTDPSPPGGENSDPGTDTTDNTEPSSPQGEIPEDLIFLVLTLVPAAWTYQRQRAAPRRNVPDSPRTRG